MVSRKAWRTHLGVRLLVGCTWLSSAAVQAQLNELGSLLNAFGQMGNKPGVASAAAPASDVRRDVPPVKQWQDQEQVSPEAYQQAAQFAAQEADEALRPHQIRLHIEGERNAVLNLQRLGLAAMARGHIALAERAFDNALSRIERFHVGDQAAQQAKSLWTAESIKDFKGEPYERAMAFYYRGLLYMGRGDFQNARAMFKRADLEDADAIDQQYAADFALMPYLAAWASLCDGDTALSADQLKQAARYDTRFMQLKLTRGSMVLFEEGRAPFKYADGEYGEKLKFSSAVHSEASVSQKICWSSGPCTPTSPFKLGDVSFQATTRGGRVFDAILEGKANFADNAQTVSKVSGALSQAGLDVAANSGNRGALNVGLFGALISIGSKVVSNATKAQADIREWGQIPDSIWLSTPISSRSEVPVAITSLSGQTYKLAALGGSAQCKLYWGTTHDPNLFGEGIAGPMLESARPRDMVFRAELADAGLVASGQQADARRYAPLFTASAAGSVDRAFATRTTSTSPVSSAAPAPAPVLQKPSARKPDVVEDLPPIF